VAAIRDWRLPRAGEAVRASTVDASLNLWAEVDAVVCGTNGAGVWKQYLHIIMPLTLPVLSSLANLGGEFFTDGNLIAAASMYVALPTLVVYFEPQRYFISGLTIGSEKRLVDRSSRIALQHLSAVPKSWRTDHELLGSHGGNKPVETGRGSTAVEPRPVEGEEIREGTSPCGANRVISPGR
jgi:hypothetical protein